MFGLVHAADVSRPTKIVGQGESRSMQVVQTATPCLALPMDDRSSVQLGYDIGQAYEVFFEDGTDIKKGDQLAVNGLTLVVSGTQGFTNVPMVSHLRCVCTRLNK